MMHNDVVAGTLTVLDRPLYDELLAASVLDVPCSTLHWWLEGGERRGRVYPPVLRLEPTGSTEVTWGELVEARYLRAYRRELGVRLQSLRSFIAYLRESLDVPYPLAHARPWVGPDRRLLIEAQRDAELEPDLWCCYEPPTGQVLLTPPAESFLERVEFDQEGNGIVVRLHPAGRQSPVVIDPEIRFGSPSVAGVPTETLDEMVHAGDSIESVATGYDLSLDEVVAALDFERVHRQPAA